MKKKQLVFASLSFASLLVGCSKNLGRVEAIETLDGIVLKVKDKAFEVPNTYSASYQLIDSVNFKETKGSFDFANTQKNHYIHSKSTVKQYEGDPKSTEKAAYTITTTDTYYYLDPLASTNTFISYSSTLEERVASNASSSTKLDPVATYSEIKGDEAKTSFEEILNEQKDNKYSKSIVTIPTQLDLFLKGLSSNTSVFVKSSLYKSAGEGNLELFIVTSENGEETSINATFNEYLVKQYEKVASSGTESISYSWNSVKYIYPDLSKAASEAIASENSNFKN